MSFEFDITVDPVRSVVRMRLAGFFSPADVATCRVKRTEAYKALRCAPHQHLTLIDMRDMAIQPQETVAEFERTLHNPANRSRRLAIIVGKTLWRSQIKRAANGRDVGFFDDPSAAEDWLQSGAAKAA